MKFWYNCSIKYFWLTSLKNWFLSIMLYKTRLGRFNTIVTISNIGWKTEHFVEAYLTANFWYTTKQKTHSSVNDKVLANSCCKIKMTAFWINDEDILINFLLKIKKSGYENAAVNHIKVVYYRHKCYMSFTLNI